MRPGKAIVKAPESRLPTIGGASATPALGVEICGCRVCAFERVGFGREVPARLTAFRLRAFTTSMGLAVQIVRNLAAEVRERHESRPSVPTIMKGWLKLELRHRYSALRTVAHGSHRLVDQFGGHYTVPALGRYAHVVDVEQLWRVYIAPVVPLTFLTVYVNSERNGVFCHKQPPDRIRSGR